MGCDREFEVAGEVGELFDLGGEHRGLGEVAGSGECRDADSILKWAETLNPGSYNLARL